MEQNQILSDTPCRFIREQMEQAPDGRTERILRDPRQIQQGTGSRGFSVPDTHMRERIDEIQRQRRIQQFVPPFDQKILER